MAHTKGDTNQGRNSFVEIPQSRISVSTTRRKKSSDHSAHGGDHQASEEHHRRGVFGKVKDKLDFTKHLGFQSAPDSLANRQALANAREREARAAEEKRYAEPAPPAAPSDRDGIGGIAETLAGVVTPKTENTPTPSSKATPTAESVNTDGEQNSNEANQFDKLPTHSMNESEDNLSSSEQVNVKEQGKEKSKDSDWGHWVVHKVHQVQRAAASKDLSDELLKESKTKATK